jgi:hypothetical protein
VLCRRGRAARNTGGWLLAPPLVMLAALLAWHVGNEPLKRALVLDAAAASPTVEPAAPQAAAAYSNRDMMTTAERHAAARPDEQVQPIVDTEPREAIVTNEERDIVAPYEQREARRVVVVLVHQPAVAPPEPRARGMGLHRSGASRRVTWRQPRPTNPGVELWGKHNQGPIGASSPDVRRRPTQRTSKREPAHARRGGRADNDRRRSARPSLRPR